MGAIIGILQNCFFEMSQTTEFKKVCILYLLQRNQQWTYFEFLFCLTKMLTRMITTATTNTTAPTAAPILTVLCVETLSLYVELSIVEANCGVEGDVITGFTTIIIYHHTIGLSSHKKLCLLCNYFSRFLDIL